ncbi:aminopeptidase N [Desulfuromonas versatilis]|uniref:Aminopeptidase N n=1 Tax=Desulfuromonas versatilis TaxID=2802975 RepID=A0ABN6DU06_9BACT|nr:aminopeptidase N [Desulfuromonas versatilis]BCR03471.1 aminopeptidase N [Desulfuromonas versatilis]
MEDTKPRAIYLQDYLPPAYLVDAVALRFELGEESTRVSSRLHCRRNPDFPGEPQALVLFGRQLFLTSLLLDGRQLQPGEYRVDEESLSIPGVPESFCLEVNTEIRPQENTSLEGLYKSSGIFCTQCEAQGFRKITYYPDRPDVMASFTTTIVAEKARYPVLLSNGNLVEQGELDGGRHFATWQDPFKKPSYLFALVAGDLVRIADSFTTASGREVQLHIYVEQRNRDKCDHAMRSLKKAMRWDEQTYGLEYDLDIYMILAVDDFNMGAMENKGLNIFNSKYVLARPDTATDADYQAIEGVIGHEYFHNWTGNRVTCRDWFQLSLKEGLTVFRDQEFSADMTSRAVKRIDDVRVLRNAQFPEDAGPMAHPVRPDSYVEINNFYTTTVYNKGAEVIRMYHTLLGAEGFRKGLQLYLERHDGQAVTTDDFLAAMAEAGGRDLGQFALWYSQAGTPVVQAQGSYDAAGRVYTLKLSQSCPPTPGQQEKRPFHIPVALGLLDLDGNDLPLQLEGETAPLGTSRVLELRAAEQTYRFVNVPSPPVPSLLRGFSAPVQLQADYTEAELAFLMAHDSDPFNRWEAGQQLASRVLLKLAADHQAGRPLQLDEAFAAAFGKTLCDSDADPALLAQALALPTETYLAEQMAVADPEAIHAAREFVRRALAEKFRHEFAAVLEASARSGPYSIEPAAVGWRSLKNLCLAYLMTLEEPSTVDHCCRQFQNGDNMTDVIAALACLVNSAGPERQQALGAFYEKWREDPLVVDKWFTLQATSKRPDTLEQVRLLMEHPAFNIRNPNKVRALVGAFCHGNPARFHDRSGAGYAFLGDRVLELDRLNPQVAARLLGALTRWRKYDGARQELMKSQLQRILAAEGLSRDVYEVASKSLA